VRLAPGTFLVHRHGARAAGVASGDADVIVEYRPDKMRAKQVLLPFYKRPKK
jgi:hypothetical protein